METIAAAAVDGQVMFHQEYIWANTTRLQSELAEIEGQLLLVPFSFVVLERENNAIYRS